MRFPMFGAIPGALAVALGLLCSACGSSSSSADGCAPASSITASGALIVTRDKTVTVYTLSKEQGIGLFNEGLLTVMAGDADADAGTLDPKDPVVLVKMDPSTDTPGTYGLDALHAQVAFCPSASAKLVVTNGALTGCLPSGTPMTAALSGSLTVTSASSKKIDPSPSPHTLTAQYGTQTQQCN